MSVKTTRRGLFTLAAAAFGASTLAAAKPAEVPEVPGIPVWQLYYRLQVRDALRREGLDPDFWIIDFEHDPIYLEDSVILYSRAYGDHLHYSKVRYTDRAMLTNEVAQTQAGAMARDIYYIEQEKN